MVVAAFGFAVMASCAKMALATASPWQVVLFRSFVGLAVLAAILRRRKLPMFGSPALRGLLVLRGLAGFAALALYFYALSRIPIGDASILNNTAPVFVLLLSVPLLGERVPAAVAWLLPLFLTGVVLLVRPTGSLLWVPSLAALVSGFFSALAYLTLRRLGRIEHTSVVVFVFSWVATLGSLPLALADWRPIPPSAYAWMIAAGLAATGAQLAMTRAYRIERAGLVSVYGYLGPVFNYAFGIAFFDEIPDLPALLGGTLVIVSALAAHRLNAAPGNERVPLP
jgi:drug/metabolite transporter (DMT)-like permease